MVHKVDLMPLEDTIKEVMQQPDAVASALTKNHASVVELAQKFAKEGIKHLHLLGAGDSMFAGQCVQQAFNQYSGISFWVTQAYEYAVLGDERIRKDSAVLVISSSGRMSTTRDALYRALKSEALIIGITDKPGEDNPFYTLPTHVLVPGAIKLGWPTQTTTATIIVLLDLAIQIGFANGTLSKEMGRKQADQLEKMPALMSQVLTDSNSLMSQLANKFVNNKTFYFIGSGAGYGVANIGSALMAEGPQRIGVPLYVEEFHHSLRINTIDPGMPVFLIAPKDPAYQRYLDTAQAVKNWGGYMIAFVEEGETSIVEAANSVVTLPAVPDSMTSLLSILPLHQFSIELTRCRVGMGYHRPWSFVP